MMSKNTDRDHIDLKYASVIGVGESLLRTLGTEGAERFEVAHELFLIILAFHRF